MKKIVIWLTISILAISAGAKNDSLQIVVDHSKTIQELIALGNYSYVNSSLVEYFSVEKNSEKISLEMKTFSFSKEVEEDMIKKAMLEAGFRPATFFELLTYALSPEVGPEKIIALGSAYINEDGYGICSCLKKGQEKELHPMWIDSYWDTSYSFLGVKITL